jgi:hypothetical protein
MNLYKKPQFDHNFNESFEPLHEHIKNLCKENSLYAINSKESKKIFKQIDNGGDGQISVDEIFRWFCNHYLKSNDHYMVSKYRAIIKLVVKQVDSNGDNELDLSEFEKF